MIVASAAGQIPTGPTIGTGLPKDCRVAAQLETIGAVVRRFARQTPHAPAVQGDGTAPLGYAALAQCLDDFRRTLNQGGIGRGNRVAFHSPDKARMAVCFLGLSDGATAVPINPDLDAAELERLFRDTAVTAVILETDAEADARDVALSMALPVIDMISDRKQPETPAVVLGAFRVDDPKPPEKTTASDIALILQTTGTTAAAKLVPLSHTNFIDRALKKGSWLDLSANDRAIQFMPLHHGHGINGGLMVPLTVGGSVVFLSDFTIDRFYQCLDRYKPTWYSATPAFHQAIESQAHRYRDIIQRSPLRVISSSSGGIAANDLVALEKAFGTSVANSLNLTEAGTLAGRSLRAADRRPGTLGRVMRDSVAIMDTNGKTLPPGAVGEIVARGPSVFSGYLNDPETTAASFFGDWYRTGDLGSLDADGYLTLHGRAKETINRGGEKIAPLEIEGVLLDHPDVREAVAFPIPHRSLGDIVGAAVVPEPGRHPTPQTLKDFMLGRIADYKVPVKFLVVDTIPKGAVGKVQRNRLASTLGVA